MAKIMDNFLAFFSDLSKDVNSNRKVYHYNNRKVYHIHLLNQQKLLTSDIKSWYISVIQ